MNQIEILEQAKVLLMSKQRIELNIDYIKNDEIQRVSEFKTKLAGGFEHSLISHVINKERLWNKMKYLILAEMEETLDEINAKIDNLVTFKEEQ